MAAGSFSRPFATLLVTTPLPGLALIMAGMSFAPRLSIFSAVAVMLGDFVNELVGVRIFLNRHAGALHDAPFGLDRAEDAVQGVNRHSGIGAARCHGATPGPIQTAHEEPALPMMRATRTICSSGISVFWLPKPVSCPSVLYSTIWTTPGSASQQKAASSMVAPVLKRLLPSLKSPTNSLLHIPSVIMT